VLSSESLGFSLKVDEKVGKTGKTAPRNPSAARNLNTGCGGQVVNFLSFYLPKFIGQCPAYRHAHGTFCAHAAIMELREPRDFFGAANPHRHDHRSSAAQNRSVTDFLAPKAP
jgi:hypothetical protein